MGRSHEAHATRLIATNCRLPLGFDIRFPSLLNGRTNCCTGQCLPAPVAACMRLHRMHHAATRPIGKQKLPIAVLPSEQCCC